LNQVKATVISNEQLWGAHWAYGRRKSLSTWLMWLNCPEVTSKAKPGQFIMANCGQECLLPRPFSIHQVNDKGAMALLYAVLEGGKGTHWLSQRQKDDTVELLGPLGNGFFINSGSNNLLLVAGGIGIAPLRFLAQEALYQGYSVTLLLGAPTANQLYSKHFLPPEAELIIATEDGTAGKKGMITDLLPDFIDWADQIFACGPIAMYHNMSADVQRELFKNKPVQISLEVRMGCGLGVCYGCTVKTKNGLKQVCKDGPVFDLENIVWDELNY